SASTASLDSPPISASCASETPDPAKRWWSPLRRARSAQSLARSPASRAAAQLGSPRGKAKCDWLGQHLGFHAPVHHKAGALPKALKEAAPNGIDVYFDNVGGGILEACLFQMNNGGRIACCGFISAYDVASPPAGPRGVPSVIVFKRLTMKGFILTDFYA